MFPTHLRPAISALLLSLVLSACGGGGSDQPVAETPPPEEAQMALHMRALSAFQAIHESATGAPEVAVQAPPRCNPESDGCGPLPVGPLEVAGIDMVAAVTDPDSTKPNGSAWLKFTSTGNGGDMDGSTNIDADTLRSFNPAKGISGTSLKTMSSTLKGTSAGAQIVNPKSGTNWRRVKIHQTYRTSSGSFNSVCSGTMIDSQWVITNAHCVWNPANLKNGYVDSLYVSPGYESGFEPMGRAYATKILIPDAYKNTNEGWTDVAWVKLDRAIGGLTGWDSYGASTGCAMGMGQNVRNQAYPAGKTGGGGAFTFPGYSFPVNGKLMWETLFQFDKCLGGGSHFQLNYPQGGGASGSSAIINNTVRALFESSDSATNSRYVALIPDLVAAITQSLYDGGLLLTSKPDLVPASIRVVTSTKDSEPDGEDSPVTTFTAGEKVTLVAWFHNASFTGNHSGPLDYALRISSDDAGIDFFDQTILTRTATPNFVGTKQTVGDFPQFTIPCPKQKNPGGIYYIGVRITNIDANVGNNASMGFGAVAKVRITNHTTCTV